jgi:hypothetical protein
LALSVKPTEVETVPIRSTPHWSGLTVTCIPADDADVGSDNKLTQATTDSIGHRCRQLPHHDVRPELDIEDATDDVLDNLVQLLAGDLD